jgi:hypothetical protein
MVRVAPMEFAYCKMRDVGGTRPQLHSIQVLASHYRPKHEGPRYTGSK